MFTEPESNNNPMLNLFELDLDMSFYQPRNDFTDLISPPQYFNPFHSSREPEIQAQEPAPAPAIDASTINYAAISVDPCTPRRGRAVAKCGAKTRKMKEVSQCSICLLDIKKNTLIPDLQCCHQFHRKCLRSWVKKQETCPLCRKSIKCGEAAEEN